MNGSRSVWRLWAWLALLAAGPSTLLAQATPMSAELKADGVTRITCEYDGRPIKTPMTNNIGKGEYHYDLYLPPGYGEDKTEVYPCLFVMDSAGNAQLRNMAERVKRDGMIAVMLVEAKNGDWQPIFANFCAAHDDAVKRVRIGLKWMTGLSGGARATTLCTGFRPGFTGMFLQSAGFAGFYASVTQNPSMAVFATFGKTDMNLAEAAMMARDLPRQTAYDYEVFNGGHEWAPGAQVDEAFDWLERWTYLWVPAQPAGKAAYLHYFKLLQKRIETAPSDFEKFDSSERAVKFATSHKLIADRALAEEVKTLKTAAADLAKNPTVKIEIAAREEYEKVRDAEEAARRRASGNPAQLKSMLSEAVTAYQVVGAKHPDTRYAAKAAQAVERLKIELN